jgi:hypothetical protein
VLHEPQWSGSLIKSTQLVPHSVSFTAQVAPHCPSEHTEPAGQTIPQSPQFSASDPVSTHSPSQSTSPAGQSVPLALSESLQPTSPTNSSATSGAADRRVLHASPSEGRTAPLPIPMYGQLRFDLLPQCGPALDEQADEPGCSVAIVATSHSRTRFPAIGGGLLSR